MSRATSSSWTLAVLTDGRKDYLAETVASARRMLPEPARRVMLDDSGDRDHQDWLAHTFPEFDLFRHETRQGLAVSVADLWSMVDTPFLFHLEDDFTFNRPVDVDAMIRLLQSDELIGQVCLLRQPWNAEEQQAGGIIQKDPDDYHLHYTREGFVNFHTRLFSLNPCVIPKRVYDQGWHPDNERGFTDRLVKAGYRFAYWGAGEPWVTHIGVRSSLFSPAGRR